MRNLILGPVALIAGLCALPVAAATGALAAASGSYICAIGDVYECEAVNGCKRVSTDAINLSEFIIVDVDKKQLTEAAIGENGDTEDIEGLSSNDKNIFPLRHAGPGNLERDDIARERRAHRRHLERHFVLRAVRQLHEEVSASK